MQAAAKGPHVPGPRRAVVEHIGLVRISRDRGPGPQGTSAIFSCLVQERDIAQFDIREAKRSKHIAAAGR